VSLTNRDSGGGSGGGFGEFFGELFKPDPVYEVNSDLLWLPVPTTVTKYFPLFVAIAVFPVLMIPFGAIAWWVLTAPVSF